MLKVQLKGNQSRVSLFRPFSSLTYLQVGGMAQWLWHRCLADERTWPVPNLCLAGDHFVGNYLLWVSQLSLLSVQGRLWVVIHVITYF